MRAFNYSLIKDNKWDSELLGLIAAIYKEVGKQEMYLKQKPQELEKLVEIAKIQSTEASNAIEGIVTTNTRIRQLMEEKTTPRNRDEKEIAGYRDVLGIILCLSHWNHMKHRRLSTGYAMNTIMSLVMQNLNRLLQYPYSFMIFSASIHSTMETDV